MTMTTTTLQRPDIKTSETKLSKAKANLILEHPFYASLICNMTLVSSDTTQSGRIETDGETIWFNPAFIAELPQAQVQFVLCHEVMHAVLSHMFRRGTRDPRRWNQAGDYLINGILKDEEKMEMWPHALYWPDIVKRGKTTEGIYELLADEQDDSGGDGDGKGGMSGNLQGGPGKPDPNADPLDSHIDAPGDAATRAEKEASMKVQVAQAAQAAKMCGNLSAGVKRLVDMALKPVIDWKEVLRDFVTARAKNEYSYARPKRRWLGEGMYLPSQSGEQMGNILVAIDMSGSISQKEASEFIAELRAIKEDTNPAQTHVVYFDSVVAGHEVFEPDDDLDTTPVGGGGTAFSPIFRFAEEHDIEPVCAVILTDLYCSDYGPQPDYPVMWVSNSDKLDAPWGVCVPMHPEKVG